MKRFYLPKLIILTAMLCGLSWHSQAQTTTYIFNGTNANTGGAGTGGTPQAFVVPPGVSIIGVDMYGASGGFPCCSWTTAGSGPIAQGGRVQCTMNVTPGSTLWVYVGGHGGDNYDNGNSSPPGWNGGGQGGASTSAFCASGGGASDIRTINYVTTPTTYPAGVLVVAGAGGGGGDFGPVGGLGGGAIGGTGGGGACGGAQTGVSCTTGSVLGTPGQGGSEATYSEGGGGGGWWGGNAGNGDDGGGGGSSYPATATGAVTAITHTQGYAAAINNGQVAITILCNGAGTITGSPTVCAGSTTTLTPTSATGGTWVSANPSVATIASNGVLTGVSPGVVTITYSVPNPCGGIIPASTTITVFQAASITSGTPILCTGQASTITSFPSGGVWTSSNTATATVVSSGATTASATGAAVGTANIVYTLPSGCAATDAVSVNLSPTYHTVTITGTGGYCAGNPTVHIGLNGSNTGINYGLYSGGVLAETMAGTGSSLDFGLITAPGAYSVIASFSPSDGCSLTMIGSATVFLNPNPTLAAGLPSTVCAGSSIVLSATPTMGTWASNNIATASVNPSSGVVTGITPGTASISYTLAGGCTVNKTITINATPLAIAGTANVCAGSTTLLTDATSGGTWGSNNALLASVGIGTGVVSGVSAGSPNISYFLGTGCYATVPVIVNLTPTPYAVIDGGAYCAGAGVHIGLSYANSGIIYTLYDGATSVTSLTGAGSSLDFGLQYAAGTYTVVGSNPVTSCGSNMTDSTVVSINPLPNSTYAVLGGGPYCSGGTGASISLSNSDFGTTYQLINGGPVGSAVPGGGPISFGMQTGAGTYTVLATTGAGCTATMTGSATIAINTLPTPYAVSGGGAYCADGIGSDIILLGSDIGTNYQLYNGGVAVGGPVPGSGSSSDLGLQTAPGTYTVVATNAAGCSGNMVSSAVISINPLPTPYTVTPVVGNYCVGGVLVGLSFSDPGFTYQLYYSGVPTPTVVAGSSASINFGMQTAPGIYTVVATNTSTGCSSNMSGSSSIIENTPPTAYLVTGTGQYCAGGTGVLVGLAVSSGGISYQLYNGGVPAGSAMTGTGSALNFGLHLAGNYTVIATNTITGCTNTMLGSALIGTVDLPPAYNVSTATPGSSYCVGGTGVEILLSGSDAGTNYQLLKGTLPVGLSMPGTGSGLNFGYSMLPGVYTIVANNPATTCNNTMAGNVPITINSLPNVYAVTGGGNYCMGTAGAHVGLSGSNTGVNYQLNLAGLPIAGAVLAGTGLSLDFGYLSANGVYTAVATNTTTGCTSNMSGSPVVVLNPLPDTFAMTGDGTSYCASASGSLVGLIGSVSGISYQLFNGPTASGIPVTGTGAPISFGNRAAGTYTAVATNRATGCANNMPRNATISVSPNPAPFAVNGGGNTCSGSGTPVGLAGSVAGVNYQLYYDGSPIGGIVAGSGSAISFGPQTGGGSYTAVGIDGTSSCTGNMSGVVGITVIPSPAVVPVTGGGTFCAGGVGNHVGLGSSSSGITYQLSNGGTAVGSVVTGTGAPLDFGLQTSPGTYTVVASPGGSCQTNMTGSAVIVVNPLPAVYSVTGGGNYCAGTTASLTVNLSGSASGTTYQLYDGSAPVAGASIPGTGSPLRFALLTAPGAYSVIATNGTGCTDSMAGSGSTVIIVSPLPLVYNMMGGGDYCTGGAGVHVELRGSSTDVDYQLYNGTSTVDTAVAGTGTELDFGLQTAAGNYTVIATDQYTGCKNNMAYTATVAVNPYLTPAFSIAIDPGGNILAGQAVILTAHAVTNAGTSPMFQWYVNGVPVDGATDSTYIGNGFSNGDSVSCAVTSTGMCAGITTSHFTKLNISGEGVQQITSSGSNIALLPNPNKGIFTIKGNLGVTGDQEVSIEITDMVGHAIYTDKVMSHNGNINENISLSGSLANGMYLVNVRSASANQVFHMVIEE